jgi:hypothetical protein
MRLPLEGFLASKLTCGGRGIDDTRGEVERWTEMLRSTREEGGPNRIELTVAERDGRLVIDQVTGPIEDAERRWLTVYERAVDEVDVGGTLFFDVKVAETQGEFPFVEGPARLLGR